MTDPLRIEVLTERLRLRRLAAEDVPAWHAQVFSDPEVMRYLPSGAPVPLRRTREVLGRFDDAWNRSGVGPWGVELRATGELLGHCGLRHVEELPGETELLYALGRAHWGKGYATEAARAAVWYGFERLALEGIVAFAVPANRASRHVMEKLGMTYDRRARLFGIEVVVYRLERRAFDPTDAPFAIRSPEDGVSRRASPRAPGRSAR